MPSPQSSSSTLSSSPSSLLSLLPSLGSPSSRKRSKSSSTVPNSSILTHAAHESSHPPGAHLLATSNPNQLGGAGTIVDKRRPREIKVAQRWWIWYKGTFVFSMLETWEFVLIHTLLLILLLSFYFALSYLPTHVKLLTQRAKYYVSGLEMLP